MHITEKAVYAESADHKFVHVIEIDHATKATFSDTELNIGALIVMDGAKTFKPAIWGFVPPSFKDGVYPIDAVPFPMYENRED